MKARMHLSNITLRTIATPSKMALLHLLAALAAAAPAMAAIYPVNIPAAADGSAFFPGTQSGVGSWYRASSGQDSTSGTGWCGKKYSDSDPVIAVVCLQI